MTGDGSSADRPTIADQNPWIPMTVIMVGTIMILLDTTIVNVALHQIGLALHAGAGIAWTVTAYLLAVCATQPITGWLADRFGRKRVFLTALAVFTAASVGCAAAPTLPVLVGFRVLQGLGGGALAPTGMAMALALFPKERHGRAIAVWALAAVLAPGLGPTVGGWLVTAVSWHWLFLINAPIGVGTILFGLRLLPDTGFRERRPLDVTGLLCGTGGLSLIVLAVSQAHTWGWGSASTLLCVAVGATSVLTFVRHELATDHPLIDLRMFGEPMFRLSMAAMLFVVVSQFGRLVFMPLELESLHGVTAFRVGLLFCPAAAAQGVGTMIGGRLADRSGPRRPIMIGCAVLFVGLLGMGSMTLGTSLATVGVMLCLQSFGQGLSTSPALVAGLSELPPNLVAQGTALRSLINQMSGAISVAALGAVVSFRMGDHPSPAHAQAAYNTTFLVGAAGILLSLYFASRLPRRPRTVDVDLVPDLTFAPE